MFFESTPLYIYSDDLLIAPQIPLFLAGKTSRTHTEKFIHMGGALLGGQTVHHGTTVLNVDRPQNIQFTQQQWVQPGIATPLLRHSINQSECKNAGVCSAISRYFCVRSRGDRDLA